MIGKYEELTFYSIASDVAKEQKIESNEVHTYNEFHVQINYPNTFKYVFIF